MSDIDNNELTRQLLKVREKEVINQHKQERWKFIRFMAIVLIFGTVALWQTFIFSSLISSPKDNVDGEYVSVVRMEGTIAPGNLASAEKINPALRKAFEDEETKGVVMIINSPGGTPVQAGLIRKRMRELQAEHPNKPLICTGEDMMTSGGYMIATGCDKIFVRPSTVAGSIGVIMASFGFDQAIERFDVERRVFTAGNNKARIDPFKPLREEDKAKFETMLGNIHQEFIRVVKESRGDKLKGDDEVLFSGDFWTGHEAVELGLVDGIGDLASVMKDEFGVKHAINYSPSPSIFERANKIFSSKVSLDLGDIAGYRMY